MNHMTFSSQSEQDSVNRFTGAEDDLRAGESVTPNRPITATAASDAKAM